VLSLFITLNVEEIKNVKIATRIKKRNNIFYVYGLDYVIDTWSESVCV